MFEQQLHDIVVRLVGGNVEGGEELLVLVVQVAALSEMEIKIFKEFPMFNLYIIILRIIYEWPQKGGQIIIGNAIQKQI